MGLQPGTHLNHYRILRQLGAGGMGEVYEAEDTRLKRRVAIKILPAETGADPARRARFDREAQAVAALNHPNIVTIHSVEEAGDTRFLTMEVVDGTTLARLIPADGMPLADLLKYALPILDAVAAAHEHGIVHRDLKPANVMVTRDGRLKVLDFGVAKLVDLSGGNEASVPTMTVATSVGQIVGTAPYMSPEQAKGRPVDHRSDLFSIGILLYEMATGVRPFRGETSFSVLAAILRDQPAPMGQVRSGITPALERIVNDCLEKDPARRPQSARELRQRLETLPSATGRGRIAPAFRVAIGIGMAALLLAAAAIYRFRPLSLSTGNSGPGTPIFTRVTFESSYKSGPSLSPDGRELLYTGQPTPGRNHIYLLRLDGSGTTTDFSERSTGSDTAPTFSPDGQSMAFASSRENSQGIFTMSRSGEGARRLTNGGFDPSWMPDGKEIVFSTESGRDPDGREAPSELWVVNLATGLKRKIAGTDAVDPRVSPDGKFVAFWALPVDASGGQFAGADRDIWIQPIGGGPRIQVTSTESTDWNPAWSADGRFLFFSSDRSGTMNIWRVAIDRATGRPSGEPIAITAPAIYVGDMSVGANGALAYTALDYDQPVRTVAFDPHTAAVQRSPRDVAAGHRMWLHPDVSPDGRLVTMRSFRAQEDIWVVGADGSGLRHVTNDPARDRGSRFAPDGSILYYSSRGGTYQFWTIRPDGSDNRLLTPGSSSLNYPLPSPDGSRVAATNPNSNEQLIFDARDWTKAPERLPSSHGKGQTYLRDWSPDGKRLAAADSANTLWVFDLVARTWERVGSGALPRWLPDGRRLVAVSGGRIEIVDTTTRSARDIYEEPGRFIGAVALARDGRSLYYTSATNQSDIWTMRFGR
jgi:serine/threonine protein kinase